MNSGQRNIAHDQHLWNRIPQQWLTRCRRLTEERYWGASLITASED
jgi:hypothetical protein